MAKKHFIQKLVATQAEATLQSCSSSRQYALTEIKPKHTKYSVSLMTGISLITIAVGVGLPMQAQAQAVTPPCDAGHANTGCYITSTPATLTNTGIISGADYGVWNSGNNTTITNSSGGTINGGTSGIYNAGTIGTLINNGIISLISPGFAGISNVATIRTLTNTGTISGARIGIKNDLPGTIDTLTNIGAISAATYGIQNSGTIGKLTNNGTIYSGAGLTAWGLSNSGTIGTLTNTGAISAATYGIQNSGMIGTLTNSGEISGGVYGIQNIGTIVTLSNIGTISASPWGIENIGTIDTFTNAGAISGYSGILNYGTIRTLTNTGTISADSFGIFNNGSIGVLTNTGTISTRSGEAITSNVSIGVITNTGIIHTTNGPAIYIGSGSIGTLTNTGIISSTSYLGIVNGGTITTLNNLQGAGSSAGALTFTGNLPANYNIMINSASNYGQLSVSGTTLGMMAFGIYNGSGLQYGTHKYAGALQNFGSTLSTYLSSGITGSGTDGIFRSYNWSFAEGSTGNWDLIVSTSLTPFSTVAKNINQRNVGNALTVAALGSVSALGAPILNALYYGNYQNAQAVMDTVGGSGLAGVQSTAMQVGEMASSSVSDQIAFWRSGETMDATGRTSQEGNNPRNFLAYAPIQRKVPAKGPINIKGPAGSLSAAVAPRTFRAWGSMFGGGANYLSDAGRGAAASNIGYYGGLIGVDYQIQPNILVGVAVGGSSSNFNVGSLSTNGNLTGFHAGVYGAYTMGNSYIALNETFSAYSNQTSRKAGGYAYMPYEQLSAQFGSTEFRTRAEVGHGVLMGGLKATPFIAAEIAAYQSNAFSEQSSIYASTFALKNNGQGINSLPTFAGLRLSNAVTLSNGWRLAPVGSVAYVHEFFPQRQFNNILMSMPGADFNVAGPRSTYNLVQTKVGAQLNLNEKLALFTDFQGEFSPVSQSYGGKGGVKYVW